MLTRLAFTFTFVALGAAACASAPRAAPAAARAPSVAESTTPPIVSEEPSEPRVSAAPRSLTPLSGGSPEYLGVIDRAGLRSIVDQGLGRVLARLKLSPVLVKGKFLGFRVNQIDPAWAASGVAVNDVVLRLNGAPIERPEQALAAFESLRVASELALELSRDGQPVALRYRIEDSASISSASAPP